MLLMAHYSYITAGVYPRGQTLAIKDNEEQAAGQAAAIGQRGRKETEPGGIAGWSTSGIVPAVADMEATMNKVAAHCLGLTRSFRLMVCMVCDHGFDK